jgi:hypothetical protein
VRFGNILTGKEEGEMEKLEIKLVGTRPVILHNGRLANPIDKHTKFLKSLTGKRKKTDDDLVRIMFAEARAGAYETEENFLGMPTVNVYGCIFEAAKAFKLGKMTKLALRYEEKVEPLLVNGEKVDVEGFTNDIKNIDYRAVCVSRARIMRSRPIVRNWSTTHTFELNDKIMDKREFVNILERAGLMGVCDMRPTYGTFKVEV